jgi:signal transduction histidine kinase
MTKGTLSHVIKSSALLVAAIALIAGLFATADVVSVRRVNVLRDRAEQLQSNMISATELVTQLDDAIDRQQLLVGAHILERRQVGMKTLEAEIADARQSYADARRMYEPLVTTPEHRDAWNRLEDDVAQLTPPIDSVISMSRHNDDDQARLSMPGLERAYDLVQADLDTLKRLNHESAIQTMARVNALHRASVATMDSLAVFGVILSLSVGVLFFVSMRRRERMQERATALETSNQELEAFAGRVAHDLRNPLATVSLAADKLVLRAPEQGGTAAVMRRGVARMQALIDDLLALSRLDGDKVDDVCDPAAEVEHVCEDLSARADAGDVTVRASAEHAEVRGRGGLLRQALWNLADNAVKYSRDDVRTELDIVGRKLSDDGYEIVVRDNGRGMSGEESRRAFAPFYRSDRARDKPGTGLGLAIVKRVVEACGGAVRVDSTPGAGTTFTITLKIAEEKVVLPPIGEPAHVH